MRRVPGEARWVEEPARRKSKSRSAAVPAPRRLRNWAEAQVRGAKYRVANAARLGGTVAVGLLALLIGGLALFGQLDDVVDLAVDKVETRLARGRFCRRYG